MNERRGGEVIVSVALLCNWKVLVAPVGTFTLDFHQNGAFVELRAGELCERVAY